MLSYKQDNIIQLVFEKIFDQKTSDGKELLILPFIQIKNKTFNDESVYFIINKLTKRPITDIRQYLTNMAFQEKFLFDKLKRKNKVNIILGYPIDDLYIIDKSTVELAIINNRLDILKHVTIKLTNDLLLYATEYGYEEIYFYLIDNGLIPNSNIFYKAVIGKSMKIIENINYHIGVSDKILEIAFQENITENILFLVADVDFISPNLFSYSIMNNNFDVITQLNDMIVWHVELYFSALLSASMVMIKLVEDKIPNIHDNYLLDTSKTNKKGLSSMLTDEMIYHKNGKTYFSHTINYAIQSHNIDVIKYIIELGYGISQSNIITAIKTGNVNIVSLILNYYGKTLDHHLIYYFSINSYIPNKFDIVKVLLDYGFSLNQSDKKIIDYRKSKLHQDLIESSTVYITDNEYDIDYLMKYKIFFTSKAGYKINHELLTKIRICLELSLEFDSGWDLNDIHVIDCIYLFGNVNQIKKYLTRTPNSHVIMETLCYNQIGKFCYLIQNNLINRDIIHHLYPIITILNNPILNDIINKFNWNEPYDLKYLLLSGCEIEKPEQYIITENNIKDLLLSENIDLIKKFDLSDLINNDLLSWMYDMDLSKKIDFLLLI